MVAQRKPTWYRAKSEDEKVSLLFDWVRGVEEDQAHIYKANVRHAKLYGNIDLRGPQVSSRGRRVVSPGRESSDNLVQSVIDTAASLIAKQRLKVRVMTDGAEFTDQQQAQLLDEFLFGVFQAEEVWDTQVEAAVEGFIFGTGCTATYADYERKKLTIEKVHIDEIVVDEMECTSGPDTYFNIARRRFVARDALIECYPEYEKEIIEANDDRQWTTLRKVDPDLVVVLEAFHRPIADWCDDDYEDDKERAKALRNWPGEHLVAIDNKILFQEKWLRADDPYTFYRYQTMPQGFYGRGIAAILAPIQLRVNRLHRFVDKCQDLIAVPRVFLNRLSRIAPHQLTNEIGQIIEYTGQQPVFYQAQAVGEEIYRYLDRLERRAYDRVGVSQYTATGMKPVGLESGRALREHADQNSGRFSRQHRYYERMNESHGKKTVRACAQAARDGLDLSVMHRGNATADRINFEDIGYEDGRFVFKIESASILSYTPAGRLETVTELFNTGFLDVDEARQLLAHPDIDRANQIDKAKRDNIEKVAQSLMRGKWVSPWPIQDLAGGIIHIMYVALDAENRGAPPETIDLCVRWVEQAKFLLKQRETDTATMAQEAAAQLAAQQNAQGLQPGMGAGAAPPMLPPMPPGGPMVGPPGVTMPMPGMPAMPAA